MSDTVSGSGGVWLGVGWRGFVDAEYGWGSGRGGSDGPVTIFARMSAHESKLSNVMMLEILYTLDILLFEGAAEPFTEAVRSMDPVSLCSWDCLADGNVSVLDGVSCPRSTTVAFSAG